VATSYEGAGDYAQTVSFADRSWLTKLELHGTPPIELSPGVAEQVDGAWWCPVTPSRTLVLAEPWRTPAIDPETTCVDVTCGLAAMALIGPLSHELLARFCAIDVRQQTTPVNGFRPGSVARTPGYVLRDAEDRLLILVGWALGEYLWDVVEDAAGRLGGGSVA
jgi:heterotetrameric sarcosine oxidase gamma subunit